MSPCDLLDECPFFDAKMSHMPAMADMYRDRYCGGDSFSCARYQVFASLGRDAVPIDLFPNQADGARDVIEAKPIWKRSKSTE
jgi:hypothetical protein